MSSFNGKYTGTDLRTAVLKGSNPLIENFIYERDNILLVGKEKSNKSTLAMQICCHLSCAEPLFGDFDIPHAVNCVYIQTEGKLANTKANYINMTKALPHNDNNLLFLYYPRLPLNRPEGLSIVKSDIDSWKKPDLIVVDPLYQSMFGKIEEQEASSAMTGNLRILGETYQSAILLIHHAHRLKRNQNHQIIDEGDDAVFGSFVWKAFPETVFLIQKVKGHKNNRKLTCDTQRMGNVIESLELKLIEPIPFFLAINDNLPPIDIKVLHFLEKHPQTMKQLMINTGKSRQHLSNSCYRLLGEGKITRQELDQNIHEMQYKIC